MQLSGADESMLFVVSAMPGGSGSFQKLTATPRWLSPAAICPNATSVQQFRDRVNAVTQFNAALTESLPVFDIAPFRFKFRCGRLHDRS